ncbi:MAG: hypothetical protein ACRDPB_01000 [Nocardioidaceae bacterium]
MRNAYKYLAYAIPVLVMVQAAAIAYAIFGFSSYMEDHAIPKGGGEEASFNGAGGFAIHAIDGQIVIPLVAIVLLIVSFFAKVPGGVKWAAFILLDVIVQIAVALLAFGAPVVGVLHGLNALVLFGLGVAAARRVDTAVAAAPAIVSTHRAGEGAPA